MWILLACATDADQDGTPSGEDCNDQNAQVGPHARESCNGRDDDCNGVIDDAYASGTTLFYPDGDADGHGAPGAASERACSPPAGAPSTSGTATTRTPPFTKGPPRCTTVATTTVMVEIGRAHV